MTNFSESEQKLLKILGKRKMKIADLTNEFYAEGEHPFNDTIFVASMIRRINRKCVYFGENWSLVGEGSGRAGRTVWREDNEKARSHGSRQSRRIGGKKDRTDSRVGAR